MLYRVDSNLHYIFLSVKKQPDFNIYPNIILIFVHILVNHTFNFNKKEKC